MALVNIIHYEGDDYVSIAEDAQTVKVWQQANGLWSVSAGKGAHKNIVSSIEGSVVRELLDALLHSMNAKMSASGRSFVFNRKADDNGIEALNGPYPHEADEWGERHYEQFQ
jgi:hypothetical protein